MKKTRFLQKTITGLYSNRRWLVIILGLITEVSLFLLLIPSAKSGVSDVSLVPANADATLCRVVSSLPFSDAWLQHIQPGTLVRAIQYPEPPGLPGTPGPPLINGQLEHCQLKAGMVPVQVIGETHDSIFIIHTTPPVSDPTSFAIGAILAAIFAGAGIIIFLQAQNRPTAHIAYGLFSTTSLVCGLFNAPDMYYPWSGLLFFILAMITSGLATTFVCLFPSPQSSQSNSTMKKNVSLSAYLPLSIALILALASVPTFLFQPQLRPLTIIIAMIYNTTCFFVMIAILFWGLRRINQYERQLIRMVVSSMVFLLFPLALSLHIIGPGSLVHDSILRLLPIPLLALPLICDYALFRHQLLGTTRLLSRHAMRVLLWILLISLFIFPIIILLRYLEENNSFIPQELHDYVFATVLGLALLLFPITWNKVRDVGDHVFYHDFYEYNSSLREISTNLTKLQGLDKISAFVLPRLAQLLNTTDVVLLIRALSQDEMHLLDGSTPQTTRTWHLYRHTLDRQHFTSEQLYTIADRMLIHFEQRSHEPHLTHGILLLALYDGEQVTGFLCLGPKKSLEPYSRQDTSFLTTLAAQLALVEVNHRYIVQAQQDAQKLSALNRRVISAQEDERRHLALDLHDDVLQQAMLLLRQLSDASTMGDLADAMPLGRAVVTNLRRTCLALRPSLLDELGLAEALRYLAQQTERISTAAIQVSLICTGSPHCRPEAGIELAFYRVTQEALSNIIKHANANKAVIRLRYHTCGQISLLIVDNGQGTQPGHSGQENLGLIGMYERMASIGGQIQLRTRPGHGFIIRATYIQQKDIIKFDSKEVETEVSK